MRIVFKSKSEFGRALESEINSATKPITEAAVGALGDAAKEAVRLGRANIKGAGKFRGGWVTGLKSRVYKNRGLDAAALIYHKIPMAGIFEEGGIIIGRPLLWLPLGREKRTPREVAGAGIRLSSVNRGRRPLLVGRIGRRTIPLFVGIDVAVFRKRFNIGGIVRGVADRLGEFYIRRIRGQII